MSTAIGAASALHFIDGREVPSRSGRTFASIDPATGGELAQVARRYAETSMPRWPRHAGRSARTSWAKLSSASAPGRLRRLADPIHDHADRIGAIESRDTGKPLGQATAEVHVGADFFTYFAGHAELPDGCTHRRRGLLRLLQARAGVVGAISPGPGLFPAGLLEDRAGARGGNSVVLKMAEQMPLSTSESPG
ncbi:MAG: aldehyde dehydrogenase family protein [Chloroflexota bacterium]